MPMYITIGYGDQAGYDHTASAVRNAAHAHDEKLKMMGAQMGIAGSPVQVRNHDAKQVQTTDGPFLQSSLPVARFALIEAESLAEAIELVSKTPCAVAHGVVEVIGAAEMTDHDACVVLGASGHIGSVVAQTLLRDGPHVIAVVRDEAKGARLRSDGADIAVVDLGDTYSLRDISRPGADGGHSCSTRRRRPIRIPMLRKTGLHPALQRRSAAPGSKRCSWSRLMAQPGDAIGDLSVLWNFERSIAATGIPMAIKRGAYYFTNLDMLVEGARKGTISTMFPPDIKIPMVAPADLGVAAVKRLAGLAADTGIRHVEGAERYSFNDVAAAFADALGRAVSTKTVERSNWEAYFKQAGFSDEAAHAYARMTEVSVAGFELPENPVPGATSLRAYISELVATK